MNKFDSIQELLGLSEKEKSQNLSINLSNNHKRKYKLCRLVLNLFISLIQMKQNNDRWGKNHCRYHV